MINLKNGIVWKCPIQQNVIMLIGSYVIQFHQQIAMVGTCNDVFTLESRGLFPCLHHQTFPRRLVDILLAIPLTAFGDFIVHGFEVEVSAPASMVCTKLYSPFADVSLRGNITLWLGGNDYYDKCSIGQSWMSQSFPISSNTKFFCCMCN